MWDQNIEEVLEKFNTTKGGLSFKEANQRLTLNGKNEIPKFKKKTIWDIFIEQFKSPIILILIIAAVFAILTNSKADCTFILIVIFINARDGVVQEIPSEEVVIGDIVDLESGCKIPADLRLIDAKKLQIDESILTRRNKL